MEPIKVHKGKTVALMNNNIDTDQIIPKVFLKRIEKTGFGAFVFDEWRFLKNGDPNPDFPLNDADRQEATILITGDNFGCGSSREHAAWALKDYRFRVIIAGSYSDIFYMNSLKNGLLLIELPQDQRDALAQLSADETIEIDLPNQVVRTQAAEYPFDIDPTWKHKLENGIDDITETMGYKDEIDAYEAKWDNIYA
ncbi:3-isopropylmalate dehydratase small subunit [Trichococcus palustris]|jgi:3-isopropylmalate/(R)-2-methylmalate dehydratase small subunit|uniref:3-isopropylmalate dehydratase small subunit n=1 Tax=Trichococcus palustris TaxID=140314 RepID=A0A143Y4Y6_9LACT|nr:3-isopropylmalate dehydratase small subunit [Trichococcus palustris]CZQ80026.1 3-isopropylmalate dehydratase small subunit [Trichococcus palustris]SFL08779.1 3-isopropylmalate/(R)-2-methylmalate dehydratase small subunit [Trichococcus palustris]